MNTRTLSQRWSVWNDSLNGEFLAVETAQMTPALYETLILEKTVVREVLAPDRPSAVRGAFPEAFLDQAPQSQPRRSLRIH